MPIINSNLSPRLLSLQDFPEPLKSRQLLLGDSNEEIELLVQGQPNWNSSPRQLRIGVVGTRKPSSYGLAFVKSFISQLGNLPITIVSGGALGIDGEAHAQALRFGIDTEAWVVGPIENPNPQHHFYLFDEIRKRSGSSLVVPSLLDPSVNGRNAYPSDWIERNQWLSKAIDVLVVAEAGNYSGTWSTVRAASKYAIPVFALPGSIFSGRSVGTNSMIANGYAQPIESVEFLCQAFVDQLRANPYNGSMGFGP